MDKLIWDSQNGVHWHLLPEELEPTYFESASYVSRDGDSLDLFECHFYLCMMTCRDREARVMLQRILDTLGNNQESIRIQRMVRMFSQTVEKLEGAPSSPRGEYVNEILGQWDEILAHKPRDTGDYVQALSKHIDQDPADTEAWAELGEMYAGTGNYEQAVQAWKHVLVMEPEAYNAWARLGELRHLQAVALDGGLEVASRNLEDSIKYMCRSVELCPSYTRGWSGLYVFATKLSQWPKADRVKYTRLRDRARDELSKSEDVFAKKVYEM